MQPVSIEESDSTEQLLDYERQTLLNIPIVGNGAGLLSHYDGQIYHEDVCPDAVVIGQLGIAQFMTLGVPMRRLHCQNTYAIKLGKP